MSVVNNIIKLIKAWLLSIKGNIKKLNRKDAILFWGMALGFFALLFSAVIIIIIVSIPQMEEGTGNLIANGKVAVQKGTAWVVNPIDEKIYKVTEESSTPITELDHCRNLEVDGKYLYFIAGLEAKKKGIYRCNTKTGQTEQLNAAAVNLFVIDSGWIYFNAPKDEGGSLYKMKTDGSKRQLVTKSETVDFAVYNGWVYFANLSKNGTLSKVRTSGEDEKILVKDTQPSQISVYKDRVYYIDKNSGYIMNAKIKGGETYLLLPVQCTELNVYKNRLYYSEKASASGVYSINTKGKDKAQHIQEEVKSFYIFEKKLYYFNGTDRIKELTIKNGEVAELL
jgi:hypothetical protein